MFSWLRWQGSFLPFQHPFERSIVNCQSSKLLLDSHDHLARPRWTLVQPGAHIKGQYFCRKAIFLLASPKTHVSYFWLSVYHHKTSHNYEPTIISSEEILSLGTRRWENYFLWLQGKNCITDNDSRLYMNSSRPGWGEGTGRKIIKLYIDCRKRFVSVNNPISKCKRSKKG